MVKHLTIGLMVAILAQTSLNVIGQTVFEIQPNIKYVTADTFDPAPGPGDIVQILASRTEGLKFVGLQGSPNNPILFINSGGQVNIQTAAWGALEFLDCKYIKLSGTGDSSVHFGFKLFGSDCGLAFSGYSSDCEAEYVEILGDDETFFGIYAKKDFKSNPPDPIPQFNNLIIHDNYIHDVSEGMYIGETVSPGMEFRHVKIYNNVVENTHRESIQIANCVEEVEINNNLLVNSGLHDISWQKNILQIGGNSVAKVFNNILVNGPDYGLQILGMGNIEVFNNYIENNKGVFIDNRYWPIPNSPIKVENNFFRVQTSWEVIKNMNETNNLYITGNLYDSNNNFFFNASTAPPIMLVENNTNQFLDPLEFTIENGLFNPSSSNNELYQGLGPEYIPPPTIERIILDKNMLTDMVAGGSIKSPSKLVDEQSLDPDLGQHPTSKQWKPAKNNDKAPFQVVIDFGSPHYIDRLLLHDYRRNGEFIISYLENDMWIQVASDKLKDKNVWSEHLLGITSNKILLTMNTWKAFVNEIAVFGYALHPVLKSEEIAPQNKLIQEPVQNQELKIYPNPASDFINIDCKSAHSIIQIFDAHGRVVLRTTDQKIDISRIAKGSYYVQVKDVETQKVETKRLIIAHE